MKNRFTTLINQRLRAMWTRLNQWHRAHSYGNWIPIVIVWIVTLVLVFTIAVPGSSHKATTHPTPVATAPVKPKPSPTPTKPTPTPTKPTPTPPKPTPPASTTPTTLWIQQRLQAWGFGLTADGIMGSTTEADIEQFQSDHGLVVDGLVGELTQAALAETPSAATDTTPPVIAVTTTPTPVTAPTIYTQIVSYAKEWLGVPYVWGGASWSGVDCSGLTMEVYAHFGHSLPHSANDQYLMFTAISQYDLEPGDLVFFHDTTDYVYHVGIWVSPDTMIDAPHTGTVVQYNTISGVGAYYTTFGTITH